MQRILSKILFIFIIASLMFSCGLGSPKINVEPIEKLEKKDIEAAQRLLVKQEKEKTEAFIKRSDWNVLKSSTGLFYEIYERNSRTNKGIRVGDIVQISYSLRLITGLEVRNSEKDGLLYVNLGKSDVEQGLIQLLLLMKEGDRARAVIPSHLAFGLTGNSERNIPPYTPLIYDVKVETVLD